jgi:hypothetical protein
MIAVDDGAATFRFPVDHGGSEVSRPRFIDLEGLDRHAAHFEAGVFGCIDYVSELDAPAG